MRSVSSADPSAVPGLDGCRWLVYALGGGLGHLTRSLALARAAVRAGHQVRILSNSSAAHRLPLGGDEWAGIRVETPPAGCVAREDIAGWVGGVLGAGDYEVFVVDTFPRGLAGELFELLDGIKAVRILVHRDLTTRYVEQFGLREVVRLYHGVLVPGEPAPMDDVPHAIHTAPWLLLDAAELPDRCTVRMKLGVQDAGKSLVGVVRSGRPDEEALAGRVLARLRQVSKARILEFRPFDPVPSEPPDSDTVTVWPLLRVMPGLDVLVGAGGYNTVQEARAIGVPYFGFAHRRLYDRQDRRLRPGERVWDEDDAVARVLERLGRPRPVAMPIGYRNGVGDAVAMIDRLLKRGRRG